MAQALGHAPVNLSSGQGDLYLAGCHKWIGSGLPLSVAIAPRRRTRESVSEHADSLLSAKQLNDPLLRFAWTLAHGGLERMGGTVNLAPLFTASAAVSVQLGRADSGAARFRQQLENRRVLSLLTHGSGWEPVTEHPDYRSGIMLLNSALDTLPVVTPDRLQCCFRRHGVALTAFPGGIVRVSLPDIEWNDSGLSTVLAAFRRARIELNSPGSRQSRRAPQWVAALGEEAPWRPDGPSPQTASQREGPAATPISHR